MRSGPAIRASSPTHDPAAERRRLTTICFSGFRRALLEVTARPRLKRVGHARDSGRSCASSGVGKYIGAPDSRCRRSREQRWLMTMCQFSLPSADRRVLDGMESNPRHHRVAGRHRGLAAALSTDHDRRRRRAIGSETRGEMGSSSMVAGSIVADGNSTVPSGRYGAVK